MQRIIQLVIVGYEPLSQIMLTSIIRHTSETRIRESDITQAISEISGYFPTYTVGSECCIYFNMLSTTKKTDILNNITKTEKVFFFKILQICTFHTDLWQIGLQLIISTRYAKFVSI